LCSIALGPEELIAAFERRLAHEIMHPVFGYRLSYRRVLEVQARLLGRHLLDEIPELPAVEPR
jgi:CRISPR/Cas system-associated endonuclease Cas1